MITVEPEQYSGKASSGLSDLTLRRRVYEVSANPDLTAVLLDADEPVDTGYRFFFRLGEDLPRGKYSIYVEPTNDGDKAYILAYQTTPGIKPAREIMISSRND